jgi:CheY-like chemotaxis protein
MLDDDRDDTELVRLLLRKAGFLDRIQVFREGEGIIKALGRLVQSSAKVVQPLLCLLDVRVPSLGGLDVLHWIRTHAALDRLPVAMLSSSEHPRDIQQAMQNGAQCYLTKYPQPKVLRQVLEDAQRFATGTPAEECFRIPDNLLLVRCRRLNGRPTALPATFR